MYNALMSQLFGQKSCGAKGGAIYSAAVCIYIVASLVISYIIQGADLFGDGAAYLLYLASPIAIAATMALCPKVFNSPLRPALRLSCKPKYVLIAALAAFGLLFCLSYVNNFTVYVLQLLGYTPSGGTIPSLEGWGMLGALIVVAVIPAVAEECLFRGAMLGNLAGGAGEVKAIFLTGFVFALFHGSPEQTVYQFICGCIFALLAVRSGSILPPVIAHFLNNGTIIILNGLSLVDGSGNLAAPQWASVLITVLAALALAGSLVWLILDKNKFKRGESGQVKSFFAWAGVGIAVMALVWLLSLLQGFGAAAA